VAGPPHVPQPETELEEFFDLSIDPLSIIGFYGEFKRVNASFVRLEAFLAHLRYALVRLRLRLPTPVFPR
jgi:hypothetical protein